MFDPLRLRLLEQLERRGSMAAVAAALGYSPSAVSQQLAALQRQAGVPLVEKVGRGVRLTPEGSRLAERARTILTAMEAAELDLAEAAGAPRGRVAMASFASAATRIAIPVLAQLRAAHPAVTVELQVVEPPAALEAVLRGDADLGLAYDFSLVPAARDPGLQYRGLSAEEVVLASAPADPPAPPEAAVDLEVLADADWIVGAAESADHDLVVRACAAAGFEPRIRHACDDFRVIADLVAAGLGVALVPRDAYPWGSHGVALHRLAGLDLRRRTFLAVRPAAAGRAAVRLLVDRLATAAGGAAGRPG